MARRPESDFSNAIVNPQADLPPSRQEEDAWDPAVIDVADPLEGLSESDRLSLAIRFGGIRMCAALTHGHSFESSIFRLPSKCLACQELVWGPFTRGCVCLVCKLTAHRSCTGSTTMPKCPTKDLFADFCRLELGIRRPGPAAPSLDVQEAVLVAAPVRKMSSAASAHAEQDRVNSGDMEGWATVEETTANDSIERNTRRRESTFSWSPFGSSDRKRPLSSNANNNTNERQQPKLQLEAGEHAENIAVGGDKDATNVEKKPSVVSPHPDGVDGFSGHQPLTVSQNKEVPGADPATASAQTNPKASVGIRDVGKMSVAGGVVGAVLGGPMGAVVGLKVGAVVGAGRWSVQGLWQRIEEDRQAAGAAAGLAVSSKSSDGDGSTTVKEGAVEAGTQGSRDIWARIAYQVQEEEQPSSWELDPEQRALLEHGECDTGEVATFVVSKLLADDTTMPSRLYKALLDEFRSRHRLCICRRTVKRRSGIADMVALFPRVGGGRRTHREAMGSGDGGGGGEINSVLKEDGTILSTSTLGLEKTFSFVEETEIVEGEESDAASGDFMENGYGSGVEEIDVGEGERSGLEPREEPVVSASTPKKSVEATARFPTAARRVAVSAIMSREASRNRSCRLDSWVRLEGSACVNCGSRTADVSPHAQMTVGSFGRDVEDVRGGLGDSWTTTEASSCSCADEEGLSASPEIIDGIPLHEARKGGSGEPASISEREDSPEETLPLLEPKGRKGASQREPAAAAKTGRESTSSADFGENRARETTETDEYLGRGGGGETCDALRDVHGVLRELTLAVLSCCPILTSSDDASIQAVNCVDQQILGVTYGPVYARVALGQARERDTMLAQLVRRDEYSRREAGRPSLAATCDTEAIAALRSAGTARTGRDKLEFLVQAVERVSESLPAKATTDMLLRSLCRHLAAATMGSGGTATRSAEMWGRNNGRGGTSSAPLPRPHAEVAFVEQFMRDESWLMGKQGYVLTTVDAALHVLLDPAMSDEIFSDSSITVEGDDDPEGSSVEQTFGEDGS